MTDDKIQAKLKEIQDLSDILHDISRFAEALAHGDRLTMRTEGRHNIPIAVFDYSGSSGLGIMTSLTEWARAEEKKIRDARDKEIGLLWNLTSFSEVAEVYSPAEVV